MMVIGPTLVPLSRQLMTATALGSQSIAERPATGAIQTGLRATELTSWQAPAWTRELGPQKTSCDDISKSFVYYLAGVKQLECGRFEEAITNLDRAIEHTPELSTAYVDRAYAYLKLQRYEETIRNLDKANTLGSIRPDIFSMRGTANMALGFFDAAISDYDQYFESTADIDLHEALQYADHYFRRAAAKLQLGRFQEAIEDFDKGIALAPDDAAAYFLRGQAKNQLDLGQEAADDFAKALKLEHLDVIAAMISKPRDPNSSN